VVNRQRSQGQQCLVTQLIPLRRQSAHVVVASTNAARADVAAAGLAGFVLPRKGVSLTGFRSGRHLGPFLHACSTDERPKHISAT
jgi:hypothetical protein